MSTTKPNQPAWLDQVASFQTGATPPAGEVISDPKYVGPALGVIAQSMADMPADRSGVNSHFITFLLLVEKDSPAKARDDLFYPAVRDARCGFAQALASGLPVWEVPGPDGVPYAPLTVCDFDFGDPMGTDETLIEASIWAGREIPESPGGDPAFPFDVPMLTTSVPAILQNLFGSQGLNVRLLQVKYEKTHVTRRTGVYV